MEQAHVSEAVRSWGQSLEASDGERMIQSNSHRTRYSVAQHTSTNAWTHGQSLSGGWSHVYEQLDRGRFHGEFREAWLGPLQLVYESVSGPIKYDGRPWRGSRLFFSYLSGEGGFYYDKRRVEDNLLTTSRWDSVDRVTCSHAAKIVLIAVDEDYLNHFTVEAAGREFFRKNEPHPTTYTADPILVKRFQTSVLDVLRSVQLDPSVLDIPVQRDAIRNNILQDLLSIFVARTDSVSRLPPPCTRAYIVDKAIEFIDSRLSEPVTIADICAAVRVCPRTLCYSFEAVLGVTPSRYLLATRLNRVRRDIITHSGGVPLQVLAARWGLCHMGRFAHYYRETFGERPSDTMRTAALRPSRRSIFRALTQGLATVAG
jgi:AraC family transcriptional regulator, ethanolamine operon transcriptional activator